MTHFSNWMALKENQVPQAPLGEVTPQQAAAPQTSQVDEMQIKSMLKKRIEMFFKELEGYKIPKSKSIELLALIMQEFKSEMGLTTTNQRQALNISGKAQTPIQQPQPPVV